MRTNPADLMADLCASPADREVWSRPVVEILPVEQTLNDSIKVSDDTLASKS